MKKITYPIPRTPTTHGYDRYDLIVRFDFYSEWRSEKILRGKGFKFEFSRTDGCVRSTNESKRSLRAWIGF
jgi:hypothetical protein